MKSKKSKHVSIELTDGLVDLYDDCFKVMRFMSISMGLTDGDDFEQEFKEAVVTLGLMKMFNMIDETIIDTEELKALKKNYKKNKLGGVSGTLPKISTKDLNGFFDTIEKKIRGK